MIVLKYLLFSKNIKTFYSFLLFYVIILSKYSFWYILFHPLHLRLLSPLSPLYPFSTLVCTVTMVCYRPHTYTVRREGNAFTGVCLFVCPQSWGGGVYHSLWSQVPSPASGPRSFVGEVGMGVPQSLVPGPFSSLWYQGLSREREGVPLSGANTKYPQDRGTPPPWAGQGVQPPPPPVRTRIGGTPSPHHGKDTSVTQGDFLVFHDLSLIKFDLIGQRWKQGSMITSTEYSPDLI